MSKKGIAGITGKTNPVVGKSEAYKVTKVYAGTTIKDYSKVKWILFKKINNEWVKLNGSEKTGLNVDFTFSEVSSNKELLLEAYIHTPEVSSPPGLILKPSQAQEPSFTKLEVLDSNGNIPKEKFSYGQTLTAKATCVGMEGEKVIFQLWEDDAQGSGHNEDNKKNFCDKQTQIIKKGIASVSFLLKPNFVKIANAYLYPGDTSEGATHEYYVTVQSSKTYLASSNTDVRNPEYAPPAPVKPKPEPKSPPPVPVPVKPDLKPNPAPDPVNSPAVVGKNPKGKGTCPNCDKDISVSELKKVYKDAKDNLLSELATGLNKYRKKFGLNTCARKAHFFAQSIQEVSTTLTPGLEGESMNYSATALPAQFIKFSKTGRLNGPPNDLALKYGRTKEHKADQKMIANIAYNGRLGNKMDSEDGWNFRGRGLLQITGRSNYAGIQKVIDSQFPSSGVNVSEGTAGSYTPEQAAITGLADWYKDKMYLKADLSMQRASDDVVVDAIVNIINKYTNSRAQRKVWYRGGKAGDLSVSDANSMKSIFQVNACNGEQPKTEIPVAANAKGIITYRIYSDGKIEKHIPKSITAGFEDKYKYVYHDSKNEEHVICTVDMTKVDKRNNGRKTVLSKGYISTYDYPKGGNAQTAHVYPDGDIIVTGTQYGVRGYSKGTGKVELVRMKDSLKYESGSVKVFYSFSGSQRRYCNPDTYAGFIGALAHIGRKDVTCTGMCFADATSYPSVSHPNGDSADTSYFTSLSAEQVKVDGFKKYHFQNVLRGQGGWYSKLQGTRFSSGHEDHLHSGDFNSDKITIIKK